MTDNYQNYLDDFSPQNSQEIDSIYKTIRQVLHEKDPKLAEILDHFLEEERNVNKQRIRQAEERLVTNSADIDELVARLEESDKTISSLREELQNKEVIIESLDQEAKKAATFKQKADKLESTLFELRLELADSKQKLTNSLEK